MRNRLDTVMRDVEDAFSLTEFPVLLERENRCLKDEIFRYGQDVEDAFLTEIPVLLGEGKIDENKFERCESSRYGYAGRRDILQKIGSNKA